MYQIYKSETLNYSRKKIFSLVNDVDGYSQFLPWCEKAEIEKSEPKDNGLIYTASIYVKIGFIRQKFTTINRAKPYCKTSIRLKDGPFRKLNGVWRFEKTAQKQTKISLKLEFEFLNPIVEKTFGRAFHMIAGSLLSSFIKRAHQKYNL